MHDVSRGSFVALITPFNQRGKIDWKSLERLAAWQVQQGSDGIVCCGTTGEGMTLSEAEKKKIAACCVAAVSNRIPVIVNSGMADTLRSARLTEQMGKLGVSGCLAVVPYYNKPSQQGCVRHFQEIARAGLPVIVYNNPGRSAMRLEAETIAEIAQIPGVAAIKESSGDLEWMRKIRKLSSIPILAGDDHLTYEILKEGGSGAISVIGNLIPKIWKKMVALALSQQWEASRAISDRCRVLYRALFLETNPQCVKFAVSKLGKCQSVLRLPLLSAGPEAQQKITEALLLWSLPQFSIGGSFGADRFR